MPSLRRDSAECSEITAEGILRRPVCVRHGLAVCPRTVEELQQTIGDQIQKPPEGLRLRISLFVMRKLGQMQRQWSHRTGQTKKQRANARTPVPGEVDAFDRRAGKIQRRTVAEIRNVLRGQL